MKYAKYRNRQENLNSRLFSFQTSFVPQNTYLESSGGRDTQKYILQIKGCMKSEKKCAFISNFGQSLFMDRLSICLPLFTQTR